MMWRPTVTQRGGNSSAQELNSILWQNGYWKCILTKWRYCAVVEEVLSLSFLLNCFNFKFVTPLRWEGFNKVSEGQIFFWELQAVYQRTRDNIKNMCFVTSDIIEVAEQFPYDVRVCKVLMAP